MVKYIHLAIDDGLHIKLVEAKGDKTWVEYLERCVDNEGPI